MWNKTSFRRWIKNANDKTRGEHKKLPIRRDRLKVEQLEDRTTPSTITWGNRGTGAGAGDTDQFNAAFGAQANNARADVDAVLASWERVITDFNQAGGNPNTVTITITANGGNGNGASAGASFDASGHPISGSISMGRGGDGAGSGWFFDPTPFDNSEFAGNIVNAFSSDAQAGSPAAGLGDFLTVVNAEVAHVMGLFFSPGLMQNPLAGTVTFTGITDNAEGGGKGQYVVFDGPSGTHLFTTNNGGGGGGDTGQLVHSAGLGGSNQPLAFTSAYRGALQLRGGQDSGNAIYEFGRRYMVPNSVARALGDAYGYTIALPETFGTTYANLDSTGVLQIRGGNGASDDLFSITRVGGNIQVSVDVGIDSVDGSGQNGDGSNLGAFVSTFAAGSVTSIQVTGGGGDDKLTIDYSGGALPALNFDGGTQATAAGDDLVIQGGSFANASYRPGPTNDAGRFTHSGGATGNVGDITFTGLEPTLDTSVAAVFDLYGTDGADTITLDNGTVNGDGLLRVQVNALEYVQFSNKGTVNIRGGDATAGGDAGDTVVVNYSELSTGLTAMNVLGEEGGDTINVQAIAAGVTTTVDAGTGVDTVNVGSAGNSLDTNFIAPLVVNGGGQAGDTLNLFDQGTASGKTYGITSAQVTRTGNGAIAYFGITALNVTTTTFNDILNVQSTATGVTTFVNLAGGSDTANVSSNAPTNNGDLNAIDGLLRIDPGFATGTDVLNINESGSAAADTVTVTASLISGTVSGGWSVAAGVGLFDTVNVSAGTAGDAINVTSTLAGATTTVDGGAGSDAVNITGAGLGAGSTNVFNGGNEAGQPGDTFTFTPIPAASTAVASFNGNGPGVAPGDTFQYDVGGAAVTITPTGIVIAGMQTLLYSSVTNFETFVLLNPGPITVQGDNNANTLTVTSVNANTASVQIDASPVITFTYPPGFTLNFNGLGGSDRLITDYTGGALNFPIIYDGDGVGGTGGGSDSLVARNYTVGTVTVSYALYPGSNPFAGTVQVGVGAQLIAFSNLAPIQLAGVTVNYVYNLPNNANPNVVVSNDGGAGDLFNAADDADFSSIRGSTFEYTEFRDPTGSLTINGNAAFSDNITLDIMDPLFNPTGGTPYLVQTAANNGPGAASDTVNIRATDGNAGFAVNLQVNSGTAADTFNVSSNAPLNTGNLDAINGIVLIQSGNINGSDVLNVSESGAVGAVNVDIDLDGKGGPLLRQITGTGGTGGPYTIRKAGTDNFGGGVNFFGGTGVNNIYVPSVLSGEALTIDAGLGADDILIGTNTLGQLQTLDNIQAKVTVAGNAPAFTTPGNGDRLQLRDDNDATINTYVITPSGVGAGLVVRNASPFTITFNTIENLTANSGSQAGNVGDTFDVTPIAGTEMFLNAANPPFFSVPGDTLIYRHDGDKVVSGPGNGVINATNPALVPPGGVQFTNFETVQTGPGFFFNDVIDLDVLSPDATPNQVVVQRDATGLYLDILIDTDTGDNGGIPNPILYSHQLYASVGQVTVLGNGAQNASDNLQINNANGIIGKPITYDGRGPNNSGEPNGDSLSIRGTPAGGFGASARETYIVGATEDAGTWVIDPNGNMGAGATSSGIAADGDEMIVTFTNLEPADTNTAIPVFDVILSTAADNLTIGNGFASPGMTTPNILVTDNANTFESFRFANKPVVRIMGNSGADLFRVNYTTAAAGLTNLEVFGNVARGEDAFGNVPVNATTPADDNAADLYYLTATATPVPNNTGLVNNLFGQGGDDDYTNVSPGPFTFGMAGFQSPVNITGGGGNDRLALSAYGDVALGVTVTATQLTEANAVFAPFTYTGLASLLFAASKNADTIDVLSTAAGTQYLLGGDNGDDTYTVGNSAANFNAPTFNGTLANILGPVTILPGLYGNLVGTGTDTLNVDASGDANLAGAASITRIGSVTNRYLNENVNATLTADNTRLAGFAGVNIDYAEGNVTENVIFGARPSRLSNLNVRASKGNDTIAVNDTTATVQTVVDGRDGLDTITIEGENLSGNNIFRGDSANGDTVAPDNDQIILNIDAAGTPNGRFAAFAGPNGGDSLGSDALYAITGLTIEGNENVPPGPDTSNRDRLTVNDLSGNARNLFYFYLTSQGDLNIAADPTAANTGLFGANIPNGVVNVRTMETYRFYDNGENNDRVTVFGATQKGAAVSGVNPGVDDLITVGLLNNNSSALVFLNGAPYLNSPPVPLVNPGNLPGVAGGGKGVDMFLNGIQPTLFNQGELGFGFQIGLTLDGNGNAGTVPGGDRAIVYGRSEKAIAGDLIDQGATPVDIFGFGVGVLDPGNATGQAYDTFTVTDARVVTTNNQFGPLTTVNLNTGTFAQNGAKSSTQVAGLVVDGGDEAGTQLNGVSDKFVVTISQNFNIQTNGNLPGLNPGGNSGPFGEPRGDELDILTPLGSINIFSDNAQPDPNVTVTGLPGVTGPFGVRFSSIERTFLNAANGVVNIIGDNNDPTVTQNDYFKVRGMDVDFGAKVLDGRNQFSLQIGGAWDPTTGKGQAGGDFLSAPIFFGNIVPVVRINAVGGAADLTQNPTGADAGFDAQGNVIPETVNTGIDALDITAWADNTPNGWGIATFFNEGDEAGGPVGGPGDGGLPADLLIVNGVAGVSDAFTVAPSAAGAGQVIQKNAAFGTPTAVINYQLNANIIVNASAPSGTLGDTDTLTLLGTDPANGQTSGLENFLVNLENLGTGIGGDEQVMVIDDASGLTLYNLQKFTNFSTLNIDGLGGSDFVNLIAGKNDGSVTLNVAGGGPTGPGGAIDVDIVRVAGTTGADTFTVNPGATVDSGRIAVLTSTAKAAVGGATTIVNFTGTEIVNVSGGSGGADTLSLTGTGAADTFTVGNVFLPTPPFPAGTIDNTGGLAKVNAGPTISFFNLGVGSTLNLNFDPALGGGSAGDDTFEVTQAPNWNVTTVNIDGGAPSGSDSVRIVGTGADDAAAYAASASNAGIFDLTAGTKTTYNLTDVESLNYDALGLAGDSLTITTAQAIVTPGAFPGTGTVRPVSAVGAPLLGLTFENVEVTTVTGTTAVVEGTEGNDTIGINAATGDVSVTNLLNGSSTINLGGFANLLVNAKGGDDTFNVTPGTKFAGGVSLLGGAGDDTVNVLSNADSTLDLAINKLTGVAGGPIVLTGNETVSFATTNRTTLLNYGATTDIKTVNIVGGAEVDVNTAGGVRTVDYTPTGVGSGTLGTAGGPAVTITGLANTPQALQVNGAAGTVAAVFHASGGNDTITAQSIGGSTNLSANGSLAIDLVNVVAAQVLGLDGNDALTVDENGGLLPAALTFDGGNGSDSLTLSGAAAVAATYNVGPAAGSGSILHDTQSVFFTNLEPVTDNVAGSLVVNATNADNAISFVGNAISVDGFETITIANKTTVTIDGLAGNDTITVSAPAGLTGDVTVIGGAGTDTLVVDAANATVATATGTITGAAPANVVYGTVEGIAVNAVTGLTITGSAAYTVNPGAQADAGTVQTDTLPISYTGLTAGEALTLNGGGAGAVTVNASAGADAVNVASNGDIIVAGRATVATVGVTTATVNGLGGADAFIVAGDQPYTSLTTAGGGGADTLTVNGTGGVAVIDLAKNTVTETNPVAFVGVETVNVNNPAGGVFILGTPGNDAITATPTGATTATVAVAGGATAFNTTTGAAFPLAIFGLGGTDTLTVDATAAADAIAVDDAVGTVTITGLTQVAYIGFAGLTVNGQAGADTFTVTPGTTAITINGGDPIGGATGDSLTLAAGGAAVAVNAGPHSDEGNLTAAGSAAVSYTGIEQVIVDAAAAANITGTNANDAITIIARDAATDPQFPTTDGVQDFTVSVNAGAEVLFTNTAAITVNALGGNDTIDAKVPAGNGAVWNVQVGVTGGLGNDTFSVTGTDGDETFLYTATGPTQGELSLVQATNSKFTLTGIESAALDAGGTKLAGNDKLTVQNAGATIVPGATADSGTVIPVALGTNTALLALAYAGVETAVVDGTVAVVVGTAGNDTIAVNRTTGIVDIASPFGAPSSVDVKTFQTLIVNALGGDDAIAVAAGALFPNGVTVLGGDNGGGSDTLTVTGTAGTADAFQVAQGTASGTGTVFLNGAVNNYVGVEHVVLGGNGDAGDTTTVSDNGADSTWNIAPGPLGTDRVQIVGRESIDYSGMSAATVVNLGGTDIFNVSPTGLSAPLSVFGNGQDTLALLGTAAADTVTAAANAITFNGVAVTAGTGLAEVVISTGAGADTVNNFTGALGTALTIDAGDGNDTVSLAGSGTAATILGGAGDDVLTGGNLADRIEGGDGNDLITGGKGNDALFGGEGSDAFVWVPGDNSDLIEGGGGADVLRFDGAAGTADVFAVGANGSRVTFTRAPGGVTIDMAGVEQLDINSGAGTAGGGDTLAVNDLTGTDLKVINMTLAGGANGVTVNGTANGDSISVGSAGGKVTVSGLAATVNLTGSAATDTLQVNGLAGTDTIALNGTVDTVILIGVDGGAGAGDKLDLSGLTGGRTITLGAATDAVTGLGVVAGIESYVGTAAADTIVGQNVTGDWTLTGPNAGYVDAAGKVTNFAGIENVTGGIGDDTFTVTATGGLTGTLDGGAGTDTLFAPDFDNLWSLVGTNGGKLNALTFANVENLTGGLAADKFTFADAAKVDGVIDGGSGTDTLNYAAYTTAVTVDLNANTATGTGGIANIDSLVGGTAADTLIGSNAANNTWTITGTNTGNVNGFGFSGVENLTGGTGADTFAFSTAAGVTGTVAGNGGTDILDYSASALPVFVNLQTSTASGTGGFTGIEGMVGGTAQDNLTGANVNSTWTLTGANAGNVNGFTFAGVESLTGGTANDTFAVAPGGSVGAVDGGAGGTDTLSYLTYGSAAAVNLQTSSATAVGSFTRLDGAVGSAAADALTGANAVNAWTVTGANAGSVNGFTFAGFENLAGGSLADTFGFAAGGSVAGTVAGNGGTDALDYTAFGAPVTVDLTTGTATGTGGFSGIEAVIGGAAGDTLVGSDLTNNAWAVTGANSGTVNGFAFTSVENLTGGQLNDTFSFAAGSSVTGTVGGGTGTGTDTLNYAAFGAPVAVNLAAGTATATGGFNGIEALVGSGAVAGDTLTGTNVNSTWTITDQNAGSVNGFAFSGVENLAGGTAADNFAFNYNANVTGKIDGGTGATNTITQLGNDAPNVVVAGATGITIDGLLVPTGTNIQAYAVNTLGGNDTVTVNAGSPVLVVDAGTGNDTITVNQGGTAFVDGGIGTDTINIAAPAAAGTITVNQGATPTSGTATTGTALADYTNVETLNVTGSGAGDTLVFNGTGSPDTFNVTATAGAGAGKATINNGTTVNFAALSGQNAAATLSMNGLGGDDSFSVQQAANWGVTTVNIDGGLPSFVNSVNVTGTAVADNFDWTPGTGKLALTPAGSTATTYNLTSIATAQIDGADPTTAPGDTLKVTDAGNTYAVNNIKPNNNPPILAAINLNFKNIEGVQINQVPVAVNDGTLANPVLVVEDTATPINILANDTGKTDPPFTVNIITQPTNGTLTLVANPGGNPSVIYTPNLNYNGPDSFTYSFTDVNQETSNVATVAIRVTPVNDAPVVVNQTYTVQKNLTLTVPAPGVLKGATDVENDPFAAVVVTQPKNGVLTLNPNGSFTYIPNPPFTGVDSFTFQAKETQAGGLLSNVGTVTLTVSTSVPAGRDRVIAGTDVGAVGQSRVFNAVTGEDLGIRPAFDGFRGGVRVALGDVNRDGVADNYYATGPGTPGQIQIIDGANGKVLFSAFPFESSFQGGLFIAAGDVNRDGYDDIAVSADVGGGPRVTIYSGKDFTLMANWFAIADPAFRGGARIALGDVDGDGYADLAAGAGLGGGPRVSLWSGKSLSSGQYVNMVNDFFVFESTLRNGVYVGLGDMDGDGKADLIVGAGPGGGPRVVVYSGKYMLDTGGQFNVMANFFAGDPNARDGVRVSAKDLNSDGKMDLITASPGKGQAFVTGYISQTFPVFGAPPQQYNFNAFPADLVGTFIG